jgi:hypothetical protein
MTQNIQVQSSEVVVPLLAGIATFAPLASVVITDTAFNVTFTGNKVAVGDKIVISGTLGGTGQHIELRVLLIQLQMSIVGP